MTHGRTSGVGAGSGGGGGGAPTTLTYVTLVDETATLPNSKRIGLVIMRGTLAARPAANTKPDGAVYFATDAGKNTYFGDGTNWNVTNAVDSTAIHTGDATSGDLAGNFPGPLTLATIVGAAGPLGTATRVPVVTIDAKGRVTAFTDVAIALNATGDATGTLPGALTLANVGPGVTGPLGTATRVPVVTIDAKGRVTGLSDIAIALTATGDATGTLPGALTLANVGPGVTGPIGDATHVPVVTIDAKGRVTALTSVAISGGGGSLLDVQVFTGSGTWTKPAGAKRVHTLVVGAGGQGASGRSGSSGTSGGGGGGGSGSVGEGWFGAGDLGATETVTVGAGGSGGGAGVGPAASDGNAGGAGGTSSFGAWLTGAGGAGAAAGTTGGGSGGASSALNARPWQSASGGGGGTAGGTAGTPSAGVPGSGIGTYAPGGGGGGGGGNATFTTQTGGAGGYGGPQASTAGGAGGATSGAAGSAGTNGGAAGLPTAAGGGGGAGSPQAGSGGNGGAGGTGGGAGGGGGGRVSGGSGTSGAGGNGGGGIVVVASYG